LSQIFAVIASIFLTGCAAVYYPDPTPTLVRQGKGVYHIAKSGQTLWRIAQAYDIDIDQIASVNNITDASAIKEGERIFIPGVSRAREIAVAQQDSRSNEFEWPLRGKILNYFHGRNAGFWRKGIRVKTNSGKEVLAARSGTIIFADNLAGYKSTVIIDHQDGFMSVYANNEQLVVSLGDKVSKGNVVANAPSGDEGFLYFEIRRKGVAANPLFYLPKI